MTGQSRAAEYQVPFEMRRLLRGIPVRSDLRPRPPWDVARVLLQDAGSLPVRGSRDSCVQTEVTSASAQQLEDALAPALAAQREQQEALQAAGPPAASLPAQLPLPAFGGCGELVAPTNHVTIEDLDVLDDTERWARRVVIEQCLPAEVNLTRWEAIGEPTLGPSLEELHSARERRVLPGAHEACFAKATVSMRGRRGGKPAKLATPRRN